MPYPHRLILAFAAVALSSHAVAAPPGLALAPETPPKAPPTTPATASTSAASTTIQTAEELLRALETADRGIETLQGQIRLDRLFKLQGDRQSRFGKLFFRQTMPSAKSKATDRAFEIRFHTLYLPIQQRKEEKKQTWIFDGRWLIEKRPAEKQFIRREIARPGEKTDPLRVGSGPFPIPIGQPADDVLARYNAELLPSDDHPNPESVESLRSFLGDSYKLRLTPKKSADGAANKNDTFTEARLWYRKDTLLPRMAYTVNRAGDESFVQLVGLKINTPLPQDALDTTPPNANQGWDIQTITKDQERRATASD